MEENNKNSETQPLGLVSFQKRTLELAGGDVKKAELSRKLAELELDFEFVKELNREMSMKWESLMNTFPTALELQIIIDHLEDSVSHNKEIIYDQETLSKRILKLKKFKSALVALEKQDTNVIPPKYEDIEKE